MIDLTAIEAAAKAATPIYTDLFGDRYLQGPYSQCELTQAQDVFVSTANPSTVIEMVSAIRNLREQRDELLGALKDVLAWGTDENYQHARASCDKARAAIAKAEGGAA